MGKCHKGTAMIRETIKTGSSVRLVRFRKLEGIGMGEIIAVFLVAFIAFVMVCTAQTVGSGYANALKAEADKVYSSDEINLKRIAIEESQ